MTIDNFSGSCAFKRTKKWIVPGGRYEIKGFLFFFFKETLEHV